MRVMKASPGLPGPLQEFLELYRAGLYFEAHEALEPVWLRTRSPFYQGLIITAAAFCKRDRGNAVGAVLHLRRALRRLEGVPDVHLGVDVDGLRRGLRRRLEGLAAAGVDPEAPGVRRGDGTWDPQALRKVMPDLPIPLALTIPPR
ncbi:MAG: DUF309 domain-containing protein [Thermaerobacter sp.]|nr:hypothetical protein [Bacillota bacterium]REJ38406.1 MAG: hypothetical protein DIU84_00095 [Bacillota bacterium]